MVVRNRLWCALHAKINQRAKSGLFIEEAYWDEVLQSVAIPKPRLFTDEIIATIKELRELDAQLKGATHSYRRCVYQCPFCSSV